MNEAREEARQPQRREERLSVATTRHAEGSAGRGARSPLPKKAGKRVGTAETPGTLSLSRSAAWTQSSGVKARKATQNIEVASKIAGAAGLDKIFLQTIATLFQRIADGFFKADA